MSCEIRSTITRYALGSAIFTPPSFTNSAVTPSTFILLTLSTKAGGKVFSIPNKIPIFFMANLLYRRCFATSLFPCATRRSKLRLYGALAEILRSHPLPQRPIVLPIIAPYVQPVWHGLLIQHRRQL